MRTPDREKTCIAFLGIMIMYVKGIICDYI